ncbi:predicted protein [Postia placenta Mad-698-R]|uniref:Cytochrome P450 n=1 Tax=Postia placenta MAD-698-R-SB12 TaxID=670580 RepID=A0A1X6MM70_9APHY|nr:hypothetical protein POSPLADRAFT_1050134 [Postia placenta MAD-698-R-SB12]EED78988.1 predicted protein [Postia placenta Mad-698-R]OSX57504.1 hypothetical protein POSPLADRAFT_1050134 [Postia placenta MAD-698-R-SB12]
MARAKSARYYKQCQIRWHALATISSSNTDALDATPQPLLRYRNSAFFAGPLPLAVGIDAASSYDTKETLEMSGLLLCYMFHPYRDMVQVKYANISQRETAMMSSALLVYALFTSTVFYLIALLRAISDQKLRVIPTVGGSSLPILYHYSIVRNISRIASISREGYNKYRGRLFKYAEPAGWRIIVTNPQHIEEIARAPDDVLSFAESANDVVQSILMHNALIRGQLTRNINRFFPEMHDELVTAVSEEICVEDSCKNADYCDLNERFTMDVVKGALVLKLFPAILRPFIARFCTNVPTNIDEGIVHFGPAILERLGKHGPPRCFVIDEIASPGRIFAEVEMKAILAHVVVTYDVKMKEDGALPSSRWIFTALIPDQKAKVLFRRRQS